MNTNIETPKSPRGRRLIFTGEGKGKTTASLGMILRAVGRGLSVHLVQFFKTGDSGEIAALKTLPGVTISHDGLGFVQGDPEPHRQAVRRLWDATRQREPAAAHLLVLDEICIAVSKNFLGEAEVGAFLDRRPPDSVTVLTGRYATPGLIAMADTVTEMQCVKHGAGAGWPAQDGVEQ